MTDDVLLGVGLGARRTVQTKRADPRQVVNAAGGYVFAVDDETLLRRFVTIGTASGTYYVGPRELTEKNAEALLKMASTRESGLRMVEIIREISVAGRAAKADYVLFALAVAVSFGDDEVKAAGYKALLDIARTGTHLFTFLRYVKLFRGLGGNGIKRAIERWYTVRPVDKLGVQMVKYRQRAGFTQRDVLRIAHPDPQGDVARNALYQWVTKGEDSFMLPPAVRGFLEAQKVDDEKSWAAIVREYGLSWEMVPDAAMNSPLVWEAFLDAGVGQTALIRQLPRLTRIGVVKTHRAQIVAQLRDAELIRKGRIHPFNALLALRTYAKGVSFKGSSTWTPDRAVIDALDEAFYTSFKTTDPTGKRHLIAIDVSGSMTSSMIFESPLSAREAAVAMAMSIARVESDWKLVAFTSGRGSWTPSIWGTEHSTRRGWGGQDNGISELNISPRQRLDDIIKATRNLPFGATDVALPLLWAQMHGEAFDVISVWTDNETWAGPVHVHQALRDYREKINPQARLAAVGMTSTDYSVAEPNDPLSINVSGMDSAVPSLVAGFARGEF